MKTLKLKNYFFIAGVFNGQISLAQWLSGQNLHGPVSRARTRFLKLIQPRLVELDEEKKKMTEEYAEKKSVKDGDKKVEKVVFLDEKGKDTTDPKLGRNYKIKDVTAFNKAYGDYLNEDFIIDVTPSNREIIYGVKDLLLSTEDEFKGGMAEIYDGWCESFENIAEDKEEKKDEK